MVDMKQTSKTFNFFETVIGDFSILHELSERLLMIGSYICGLKSEFSSTLTKTILLINAEKQFHFDFE